MSKKSDFLIQGYRPTNTSAQQPQQVQYQQPQQQVPEAMPVKAVKRKSISKKILGIVAAALLFFIVLGVIVSGGSNSNPAASTSADVQGTTITTNVQQSAYSPTPAPTKAPSKFTGDCGARFSAKMGSSIIGMPTLTISITNTSQKDIAAIQFYVKQYDVYGDEITSWTKQNYLYTYTTVEAGSSNTIEYQFIEDSVKKVDLYVYSVYFVDGTEWGDRNAKEPVILSEGMTVSVAGQP